MKFEKEIFVRNIKQLAKQKGIPLGNLEDQAGVSKGYFSRTTSPALDVVLEVAERLGVTLDYLLQDNSNAMNPSELLVMQFADKLLAQSRDGKLEWISETVSSLQIETRNDYSVSNPLIIVEHDYSPEFDCEFYTSSLISRFVDAPTKIVGKCYHTSFGVFGDDMVYLIMVEYEYEDPVARALADPSIEMYVVRNGNDVKPICSSAQVKLPIARKITDLYEFLSTAESHIALDSKTRLALESYLAPDNLPF